MNVIHASAQIGEGCELGHFCVIMEDVVLGPRVRVGNHVVIHAGTRVGSGTIIDDHATIGKPPRRAASSTSNRQADPVLAPLTIGDDCIIGSQVVLHAGSRIGPRTMVADLASVRENCDVGESVIVGRGVTVENDCTIGDHTKLQANAYITALSTLEDHVFIAPMVSTTNDNFMSRTEERFRHRRGAIIRRRARVGGNAVLLPGVTVGEEAVVAAGAVVTRDVPPYKVVMGVPARVVRDTPEEQLLEPRIDR